MKFGGIPHKISYIYGDNFCLRWEKMRKIPVIAFFILLVGASIANAWQVPAPHNDVYQFTLITEEVPTPVYLTHAGDERLFVVEKTGSIRIIENDVLLET